MQCLPRSHEGCPRGLVVSHRNHVIYVTFVLSVRKLLLAFSILLKLTFEYCIGSVPIRRNQFRRNLIRRNANPNPNPNPNFGESGFGETGRHHCIDTVRVPYWVRFLGIDKFYAQVFSSHTAFL